MKASRLPRIFSFSPVHIFRHVTRVEDSASLFARALRTSNGDALAHLIAITRLECALTDAWSPLADDWDPRHRELLQWSTAAAARCLHRPWPDVQPPSWLSRACTGNVRLPVPEFEGLRYYNLDPRRHALAARHWQQSAPAARPAWILGLRSMGSVLAPIVRAALLPAARPHRVSTLRPRGATDDRRIQITERFRRRLAAWTGAFLIVDEGPGLSGSSFAGTVRMLLELGCPPESIALLPTRNVTEHDARRLHCPFAAHHWRAWRTVVAPPPEPPAPRATDIGGGGWRTIFGAPRRTPVWPMHERAKYLTDGGRTVTKFAGYSSFGSQTAERARALARAGWGPPVVEFGSGWIAYARLAGPYAQSPGRDWAEFAGRYLAWVRSEFALAGPQPPSPALREMVAVNLARVLHERPLDFDSPNGVPVVLDAHVAPVEWRLGPRDWVKCDATDHGDDQFFPGPADIAWDLAALQVEFEPASASAALAAYRRASGESAAALRPRLHWHGLAYCLFRAAWCGFAATQVESPDAAWFTAEAARYRRAARASLAPATASRSTLAVGNVLSR